MKTNSERNPDVNIYTEAVPAGHYLVDGQRLMQAARYAGIPFGLAFETIDPQRPSHKTTVGLIVREEDRERMDAALARKAATLAAKGGRWHRE